VQTTTPKAMWGDVTQNAKLLLPLADGRLIEWPGIATYSEKWA
jgi:hypothetical protein